MRTAVLLTALALPLAAHDARAVEYTSIAAGQSRLGFVYKQMGVPVEGRFGKFAARLRFDPARPAAGTAALELDLASIDAGSPEANAEVAGKSWFDTKGHPQARFVSTAIKPLGGNRYEVQGEMSIKGRSRALSAPFTLTPQGKDALVEGGFVLRRADFGIGEGLWADFGTVANEIQIQFRFLAQAGK